MPEDLSGKVAELEHRRVQSDFGRLSATEIALLPAAWEAVKSLRSGFG